MSGTDRETRTGSSSNRRLLTVGAVVLAVAATAVLAFSLLADRWLSDSQKRERECCWKSGATPAWMAEQFDIRIPENAEDRRAGYKTGERYDSGLLSFTLPTQEATAYLAPSIPKGTRLIRNHHPQGKDYERADGFAHLQLPEPETLVDGLLRGDLCPGAESVDVGSDVGDCLELFSHEFTPGITRIYLRATIEPGLTPPPAPSGT
ncbi:hypothetical protein ACFC0D_04700 [Streptomyces sp. NPDC056222]|uniref:hypothetical protein n=1 Tax=Streptomyces sp. NPDC056222 TaxID=3345749 RepID=UPI0035E23032